LCEGRHSGQQEKHNENRRLYPEFLN
jgi:hypothetical protein